MLKGLQELWLIKGFIPGKELVELQWMEQIWLELQMSYIFNSK